MAGWVSISDYEYPEGLRNSPNPPRILFYKGNWRPEIFDNCLAVVGSRKMSLYGKKVVSEIISVLSKKITIVSGFMTGVDMEAHVQALKFGLSTIAVMPCGIDLIHPRGNDFTYNEIIKKNGLIMSEYESLFQPKIWTYPRRNRIVAGLSKAVLVIEASVNSGSLITARLANSCKRKVFVIPGSIFSNLTEGKVQISKDFAEFIYSGLEINEFFNFFEDSVSSKSSIEKRENTNEILRALENDSMAVDDLSRKLGREVSDINRELTILLLKNEVTEKEGKFYAC